MTDKAKKIMIVCLIIFVVVGGIVMYLVSTSEERNLKKQQQNVINNASNDSGNVSSDEMKDFIIIDTDKYLELYKGDKTSVVMIGRSGCEFCQTAEPIIKNIMYEKKIDVYYLSTDGFDSEDREKMLNSDKYFQEKNGMPTPLLLLVKNAKIVDKVEGLISKDEYIEFFDNNKII